MKLALPLLLAATLVDALPLKKGNTWTWSVRSPYVFDSATNWETATVVGSARHDSGTAWTLVVRDSAKHKTDTSIVVERPDKSQAWLKGSSNLALELQPWDGARLELRNASSILAPWGIKSSLPADWNKISGYRLTLVPAPGGRTNGWMDFFYFEGGFTSALPQGVWIDTVGPVIFRNFRNYRKEYRMLFHNRRAIDLSSHEPKPKRLGTGTILEWEEQSQSGGFLSTVTDPDRVVLHWWTFLEPDPDSSGWVRWRVRDSSVDDAGRVADSILPIRIHLRDWISAARAGGCASPADAWISDWTDSVTNEGILRSGRWASVSTGAGVQSSDGSGFERIGPDGFQDSMFCSQGTYKISMSTTITIRRLLAVDGRRIRKPSISAGTIGAPRERRGGDQRSLAGLPPELSLLWTDGRGRSGTLRAGEVGTLNRICPRGPVFLRATLPDGTAWNASTFVP